MLMISLMVLRLLLFGVIPNYMGNDNVNADGVSTCPVVASCGVVTVIWWL